MITNKTIENELKFYRRLKRRCNEFLRRAPEGSLALVYQHGKQRPYHSFNGKFQYLNKTKAPLILQLKRKAEVEHALKSISVNISLLEQLEGRLDDPVLAIPPFFNLPERRDASTITAELASRPSGTPYYQSSYDTFGDLKVKSKSEVILIELIKSKGINVFYEKSFRKGGIWFCPDFTLVRESDGKIIFWEHFGMMSDPDYVLRAQDKIANYASVGIMPFRDIIFTYEDGKDSLDLAQVESILRMMDLIP